MKPDNISTLKMDSIEKLKDIFKKFPTVGPRTARRFCYYLMKLPKEKIEELTNAILELKNNLFGWLVNSYFNIALVSACNNQKPAEFSGVDSNRIWIGF